jgi:hypothetical protein
MSIESTKKAHFSIKILMLIMDSMDVYGLRVP